jgi:two-component system response regulator MprA
MPTVLVVDDDLKLLKMLQRTLMYENLETLTAVNGQEALGMAEEYFRVKTHYPEVIILDWMMPKMDGLSLLQKLRDGGCQTAVLMLTARDAIENRVEGLEAGADDYLVKPFAPAELVARVHALMRRVEAKPEHKPASYADVVLDPSTRLAQRGEMVLILTVTEFNLLHLFLRHPRQVLERSFILNEVWGYDFGGDDNVLEVYIGYLRKKLEADGRSRLIQTIRGIGYVLREE